MPYAVALLTAAPLPAKDLPSVFQTDVLPLLTKAGCNAGACHGAATGQGGFRLSLLGYDPESDHARITRELGGRRVDMGHPDDSLLLRKASGRLEHEGGRRLRRDTDAYSLIQRWVADGAPYGPKELRVTGISVTPQEELLPATNATAQLRVTAVLSDGSQRDVSDLALYTSNDDSITTVTGGGAVKATGAGLTSIMVRYSGAVAAARFAVPLPPALRSARSDFPATHLIDRHIGTELSRLGAPASDLSEDAEFLRRIYLDVAGRLPFREEVERFLSDPPSAQKRQRTIDALIGSDAFVDFWTLKLADLLLLNGTGDGVATYHAWLRDQVSTNAPLNATAAALLTASGPLNKVGPAHFMMLAADPRDLSEHVARIFLGTQIACARCHAHPSDRWTQEDYHGFAAFFARISRDAGQIRVSTRGEVDHPKSGLPVRPRALGEAEFAPGASADRRLELARWIGSSVNPFFARSLVNRVWKHLMGRGLVEPVDDLRPTNPATHPPLMEDLAGELISHGFNLRHLIRLIVTSHTYQLSSQTLPGNQSDVQLYTHAYPKPLSAAVFADAIAQATDLPDLFEGYPTGTRAVQLRTPATPSPALDVLGRCLRKAACDGTGQSGGGLAQALHLINGSTINGKLRSPFVEKLAQESSASIVKELYRRTLVRPPEADELSEWEQSLAKAPDRIEAIQDLLWTLLNSREFALNH